MEGFSIVRLLDEFSSTGVFGILLIQVWILNEMRHIRKDLSNHVTDTNKKIEKLETRLETEIKDVKTKLDQLISSFLNKRQ